MDILSLSCLTLLWGPLTPIHLAGPWHCPHHTDSASSGTAFDWEHPGQGLAQSPDGHTFPHLLLTAAPQDWIRIPWLRDGPSDSTRGQTVGGAQSSRGTCAEALYLLPLQPAKPWGALRREGGNQGVGRVSLGGQWEPRVELKGRPPPGRDPGICLRWDGQPANTGVGLRAYRPGLGERETPGSLVPPSPSPSPSPSLSPPQELAAYRDKGPLRPQTQMGEGNSGNQSYFGIFRLNHSALTSPGGLMPQEGTEDSLSQELAPWTLGSHTATCNYTHMYTHPVFQMSHRHTLKFAQALVSPVCMHTGCHLHSPEYIHTGHLTHTTHVHMCAHTQALAGHLQVLLWP